MMYDELILRLREVEEMLKVAQFKEATNLIAQAADAIEELQKRVPPVPHGRLIDADAAIANRNAEMNWVYDLCDLPDYLAGCPTIIPAEEGEWTKDNTCSRCGDEACAGYDEEPWLTRYCPHCGAKMKNPEDYE